MQGLVIKSISGEYSVITDSGVIICKPLGIFRHKNISPKVGDIVQIENNRIIVIEERRNDLIRPSVANVDKVFIITSFVEPDLNLNLLDRLISLVEWEGIEVVLVFTKVDLVDVDDFKLITDYYEALGYPLYLMPGDDDLIRKEIDQHICVVAGQSGVGKSRMLNVIDPSFKIKVGEISHALGRGKHTTRHTELLRVDKGWIADTPGFGILELDMDELSLSHTFKEFFATKCRFSKCLHLSEPGCGVREKVESKKILDSRYLNYKMFINEIRNKKRY